MKTLEVIAFDYTLCRRQFDQLRSWLASQDELSERDDILPFFRARPHLAVLFGMFNRRIASVDRIAWEFDLFGDFACDLIVGEWDRGTYCLVEFEDAHSESIFEKQGQKATREWGRRFDHGYSQIIDWFHKLDGRSPSADLLARFGRYEIHYEAVLVIGRDRHLDDGEKQRLGWRGDKVLVDTRKILCLTFDELLNQFSVRLGLLAGVAEAAAARTRKAAPRASSKPSTQRRKGKP